MILKKCGPFVKTSFSKRSHLKLIWRLRRLMKVLKIHSRTFLMPISLFFSWALKICKFGWQLLLTKTLSATSKEASFCDLRILGMNSSMVCLQLTPTMCSQEQKCAPLYLSSGLKITASSCPPSRHVAFSVKMATR
eukprot:Amastigsp_a515809_32.p2 type:complete len:136 gc:universal Amastigsp_a515809_32:285-692(+)